MVVAVLVIVLVVMVVIMTIMLMLFCMSVLIVLTMIMAVGAVDLDVAEAVDLALLAVVLDGDVAFAIDIVNVERRRLAVDFDLKLVAFAFDPILDPFAEWGLENLGRSGFGLCRRQPTAAAFVVQAAGPTAGRRVALGLVAKDFAGLHMAPEANARVADALGREHDLRFENKVAEGFFGREKELFIGPQADRPILDPHVAMIVGVGPAVERLAIEEVFKTTGSGETACGEQTDENECVRKPGA